MRPHYDASDFEPRSGFERIFGCSLTVEGTPDTERAIPGSQVHDGFALAGWRLCSSESRDHARLPGTAENTRKPSRADT
jgi:hypothetical protein